MADFVCITKKSHFKKKAIKIAYLCSFLENSNRMLQYIIWDASPEIFQWGSFAVRWYGLLFALGFLFGYQIMALIFKWEKKPERDLDRLFLFMIISTVIGARLGHVLFYQPDYYLANPIEILKVWEGGLASHGAAITIILAIYLYARKRQGQSFWWVIDRLVITVALGGALIRTGNLMNSEIIGKPADFSMALAFTHSLDETVQRENRNFVYAKKTQREGKDTTVNKIVHKPISIKLYFKSDINTDELKIWADTQLPAILNGGQEVSKHYATLGKPMNAKFSEEGKYKVVEVQAYTIPRHAGQFYEAISCLLLFGLLFLIYNRKREKTPEGLLFGIFMIVCFGLRFVFEYFKENQVDFEKGMSLNMGQILSIPAVLFGLVILVVSLTRKKKKFDGNVEKW
jgi:prolipoprotein diacylglyceryltransferase